MKELFRRVEPGEEVPPPSPEIQEWASTSTAGVLAGAVFGGVREALAPREHHFVPPPRADSGAQASTSGYELGNEDGIRAAEKRVPNYKRHLMERRFLKITRGALRSGVRVGGFIALFSGIQQGMIASREKSDVWDSVAAGATACGVAGLALPGPGRTLISRLPAAAASSAVGAALCLPLGLLRGMIDRSSVPGADRSQVVRRPNENEDDTDKVTEAIARLERSLQHKPA